MLDAAEEPAMLSINVGEQLALVQAGSHYVEMATLFATEGHLNDFEVVGIWNNENTSSI